MNPEHVAIVRQGKEAIAAWRCAHPHERLDLTEASLAALDLDGADLQDADLIAANLFGADLNGASLFRADLDFTRFEATGLAGAQFFGATFMRTVILDCDLSTALGLEFGRHEATTSIGLDTIALSGGDIPDMFLRGCGYDPIIQRVIHGSPAEKTDAFYEWIEQGGGPLRFQSCFISYTTQDKAFADHLCKALNDKRIDYWYAPEHGRWGEELTTQIDRQIKIRDRLILVCSEASLTDSDWVRWEIDRGIEMEKERNTRVIFPVMIDDTLLEWNHPRAGRIREVLAADFRRATRGQAFETALTRLIEGLRAS